MQPETQQLQKQAERRRRLADETSDETSRKALLELAIEFEPKARASECRHG